MTQKMSFEHFLEFKADEIDNAAYALITALLRTHPEQSYEEILSWDMSVIGAVVEAAKSTLEKMGKQTCFPYYEEEICCFSTASCKTANCYFDDDRRNDEE